MPESSTYTTLKQQASADDRVLDIGTKSGAGMSDVAGSVVGIDITAQGYDSTDAIDFILGDGRRLPFSDDSFEYVFCTQVLEHLPSHGDLIAEAARVLTPDGTAYFSFPNRLSLLQPHWPVPRWYSLLPRRLGLLLAPLVMGDQSESYYRRSLHPLSPLSARRHFHTHFESVEFPMRLDPSSITANATLQTALWWANTVALYPPFRWVGELLWPHSTYVCTNPTDGTVRP